MHRIEDYNDPTPGVGHTQGHLDSTEARRLVLHSHHKSWTRLIFDGQLVLNNEVAIVDLFTLARVGDMLFRYIGIEEIFNSTGQDR